MAHLREVVSSMKASHIHPGITNLNPLNTNLSFLSTHLMSIFTIDQALVKDCSCHGTRR